MPPKYNLIQSLQRALSLLEHLANNGRNTGITSIAGHVGLHKSTCFGLLYTLQQLGCVVQDFQGRYSLGYKVYELGNAYLQDKDIRRVSAPYLYELMKLSSETVHLVVREGLNAVYIDKLEGPHAMSIVSKIGGQTAMYCSGVGKSILAFMGPAEQEEIMKRPMSALTPNTITTRKDLRACIKTIRKDGYSRDNEEVEIGLCCVAAPIFGVEGKVMGGISISGPAIRLTEERQQMLIPHLLGATMAISKQLGHIQKNGKA
jgi:DNA-binding IclR family transcriptional regulator